MILRSTHTHTTLFIFLLSTSILKWPVYISGIFSVHQISLVPAQLTPPVHHRSSKCRFLVFIPDMASYGLCPSIKNILLLDSEGKRVAVKYYSDDWPTNNSKLAFEKFVFSKTVKTNARTEAEITLLENNVIIYKFVQDLHFFVTGGDDENELILASVLQGFFDAVTLLLRNNVDKREALENLDLILLCLDEIVDGGMILETNGPLIAEKVTSHSLDADAPLSEQTLTQAWATAREHLTRTLLK